MSTAVNPLQDQLNQVAGQAEAAQAAAPIQQAAPVQAVPTELLRKESEDLRQVLILMKS